MAPRGYRQRHPRESALYQILGAHLEGFEAAYEEQFAHRYGRLRPSPSRGDSEECVMPAFRHFLDCANPLQGFARLRCQSCGRERLVPFSCRSRSVCPSCEMRKAIEWAEWVAEGLLEPLPHVQAVLSIPKLLRPYFLYDRGLLAELARCAWQALKLYIEQSLEAPPGYQAGAVVCIQTFAENLRWNPHVHVLLLSGMLNQAGEFLPLSHWDLQVLSEIFRREVCRMLQSKGLLTEERLRLLYSWRHSGFHVHIGAPLDPRHNRSALEGLARYLVRAPVRHAQLLVDPSPSENVELSSDSDQDRPSDSTVLLRLQRPDQVTGESVERLSGLELLARLSLHVPESYQPLRFYDGAYSNLARHRRAALRTPQRLQHSEQQEQQAGIFRKAWRRRWAYLIKKIFGEDPLVCRTAAGR